MVTFLLYLGSALLVVFWMLMASGKLGSVLDWCKKKWHDFVYWLES